MLTALAISALLFLIVWLIQRRRENPRPGLPKPAGLDSFRKIALDRITPPIAQKFWRGVSLTTLWLAGRTRLIYTGNGQTYALYVLYYFLALYVASGGAQQFWAAS
jgi:hypothetical protein